MNKRMLIFTIFLMLCSFCFSEEIKSIRIELKTHDQNEQTKIVYDSEMDKKSYPFLIFCECLTGWGRKGGCKKMNPLFVPKTLQSEGTYIIYVTTDKNDSLKKFRLMNFEAMQDLQSGCYYETNLLQYLYEYLARKYLQTL